MGVTLSRYCAVSHDVLQVSGRCVCFMIINGELAVDTIRNKLSEE